MTPLRSSAERDGTRRATQNSTWALEQRRSIPCCAGYHAIHDRAVRDITLVRMCWASLIDSGAGWQKSRCRCGRGQPRPGRDVARVSAVLLVGGLRGERSPGADVGGVSPLLGQMWPRRFLSAAVRVASATVACASAVGPRKACPAEAAPLVSRVMFGVTHAFALRPGQPSATEFP